MAVLVRGLFYKSKVCRCLICAVQARFLKLCMTIISVRLHTFTLVLTTLTSLARPQEINVRLILTVIFPCVDCELAHCLPGFTDPFVDSLTYFGLLLYNIDIAIIWFTLSHGTHLKLKLALSIGEWTCQMSASSYIAIILFTLSNDTHLKLKLA